MLDKTQKEIWNALCVLSVDQVLNLLTNYHGTQLLNEGFKKFFEDGWIL